MNTSIFKKIALTLAIAIVPLQVTQAIPLAPLATTAAAVCTAYPYTSASMAMKIAGSAISNPSMAGTIVGCSLGAIATSSLVGYMVGKEITIRLNKGHFSSALSTYATALFASYTAGTLSSIISTVAPATVTAITATTFLSSLQMTLGVVPAAMACKVIKDRYFGDK